MVRITSRQRRDNRRIARALQYPLWLAERQRQYWDDELGMMLRAFMQTEEGCRAMFRAEMRHRRAVRRDRRRARVRHVLS